MSRLKTVLTVILSLCFTVLASAQALKIGDHLPDVIIKNVYNYPKSEIRLSEFRGKLIIFDFWSRGCKSCVEAFPKMDSLQKAFGDQIQILLVSEDDKVILDKYLSSFTKTKIVLPDIPSVTSDRVLGKLFPHIFVPHHVWIDANGVVQGITNGYNTNAENIALLLKGEKVVTENKMDLPLDYFDHHSLWNLVEMDSSNHVCYSSMFTRYLKSNTTKSSQRERIDSAAQVMRSDYINSDVKNLYITAFNGDKDYKDVDYIVPNRIIWSTKDSNLIRYPRDKHSLDEWKAKYELNYEQIIPLSDQPYRYLYMQEDLNRYFKRIFGVTAAMEEREINCLVLKSTGPLDHQRKGEKPEGKLPIGYFRDYPFEELARFIKLVLIESSMPVIDETNIRSKVDLDLYEDYNDLKGSAIEERVKYLNRHLSKYNLVISAEPRKQNLLVISDVEQ